MHRFRCSAGPAGPLLLLLGSLSVAAWAAGKFRLLAHFQDPRIDESSGLAASARGSRYFFTHNDSGGQPEVYAVDRQGRTMATLRLQGASALDWEDMARGPGEDGAPALYVGDIGDNFRLRSRVTVYRLPEPKLDRKRVGQVVSVGRVQRFDLEYPDGPHDAESLLVHPRTGQVFLVTKARSGSGVYASPSPLKSGRMRKVGSIDFAALAGGGSALATGGDISPDGRRLVVRTYGRAWEWRIPGGDVGAAFGTRPVKVELPGDNDGEAIAYTHDGDRLLVSEEGKNSAVYEVRR